MGLENEKSETSVTITEDEFNRSFEPIMINTEKGFTATADRDPLGINADLKVSFDDIIGEPSDTHSFDKVWIGSNAVFELVKYVFYRLLTTILAIPLAFLAGILFAVLSCLHIWVAVPLMRSGLMVVPSAQTVWNSLMAFFVAPLSQTVGRCLSSVNVKIVPS